ncbi:MAG TPA: 3'(2'),5'-bisphosphate nucleotidase CysQ [Longimicrobiaceae bacterium]|nr:3'(2'),5'-bisphosphate nucleotidase CysQ [Longimicrobiaceae bacterium]
MNDLQERLDTAAAIARAAGAAAMRFYGSTGSTLKADESPVTAADHAANDVIVRELLRAFPGDAVLSEESRDDLVRLESDRVWIVDPLDGTKEFISQNGEFSIMIGLAVGGEAVLGAVYLPDGDVLYGAARGLGAWAERGGGPREQLRAAPPAAGEIRLVGSRSHPDALVAAIQEELGITDVLPCGSVGVKCSRIAEGARDLYVHPVPYLKEWDTCAPEVLLREAGGWVSDCLGRPLRYNKRRPSQPEGILACGPGLEDVVLPVVRPLYAAARAGADDAPAAATAV